MSFTKKKPALEEDASESVVESSEDFSVEDANALLVAFKRKPIAALPPKSVRPPIPPKPRDVNLDKARDLYWGGDFDAVLATYQDAGTSRRAKLGIRSMMLGEDGGQLVLAKDPEMAATLLGAVSPGELDKLDLDAFGRGKNNVLAATILSVAGKKQPGDGGIADRDSERDPAVFASLAEAIPLEVWNDSSKAIGAPKRGLGPKVCAGLWATGGYDEICKLIEMGVDTTVAAFSETKGGVGVYSDYVQPIQHTVQKYMRDIPKLGTDEASTWDDKKTSEVQGAKKIFKALEKNGEAVTLTKWDDVKKSEMIKQFKAEPGTIWGFEDVRLPFVEAAHETDAGVQPVRMMELWDAVMGTLSPDTYPKLLADPEATIKKLVDNAAKTVEAELDSKAKYVDVKRDKDKYMKKFRQDATNFLTEFASQVPKGAFASPSLEAAGEKRPRRQGRPDRDDLMVSDIGGVHYDKYMTSFACKAGLWWAKNEGKPVYYCLDGIDMKDVTDYKKVKNKTIEAFLSDGGATQSTKPHREVVTIQELREILKNWDEMKDTIKFSQQGKILKDDELRKAVTKWQKDMAAANKSAGRTPAPPRAEYAKDLAAIDPGLMARMDDVIELGEDPDEVDKDARSIVRKSGYLMKMSNTRPDYVLKYIMSKCELLVAYKLLPRGLPPAAASFGKLASDDPPRPEREVKDAAAGLIDELKKCAAVFRKPLSEALVRHPMIERSKRLTKKMKRL